MSPILQPPSDTTPACLRLRGVPRAREGAVDVDRLVAWLSPCDLLEDVRGWSHVVPHDGAVLSDDGRTSHLRGTEGADLALGDDPLAALDAVAELAGLDPHDRAEAPGPLRGGLVGALSYDLGRRIERIDPRARTDRPGPTLHLRHVDVVVAVPPARDRALALASPSGLARRTPRERVTALQSRLSAVAAAPPPMVTTRAPAPQVVTTSLPHEQHLAAVGSLLAAIGAGRAFQVNLSQRLTARWPGGTHDLYRALRAHSPAPHGAALPDIGLASVSPETFLEVSGGRIVSAPIKGTRRRADDPALDAALADDLTTSEKDRAENVMIVDLVRNDLGRVCRTGTVRVEELAGLASHPTVWHLVSRVAGWLTPATTYGQLLAATFPCGSVTGAPKVAAMQLIEDHEPVRRSWYCGSVGYLGHGNARLSVGIRTAVRSGRGRVDYGAGGGIVADSTPEAEHAETLDKAAAFLRAVNAVRIVGTGSTARPTGIAAAGRRPAASR